MVYDPDPYARSAGPPRHSIESDSEDDGDELLPRPSTAAASSAARAVHYRRNEGSSSSSGGNQGAQEGQQSRPLLVVLVPSLTSGPGATSGVALARALGPLAALRSQATFDLDAEAGAQATQASLGSSSADGALGVLLLGPDADGTQHPTSSILARSIVDELRPSSIVLLSTYWPAAYIVSPDLPSPPDADEAPVRFLASPSGPAASALETVAQAHNKSLGHVQSVLPLDVPNALTGVDGALVLQATLRKIPVSVLLQPFDPLHGLNGGATESIFPLSPDVGSPLPALLQASLGLAAPLRLDATLPVETASTGSAALTGDFLRSRRRRQLDEDNSAKLAGARLGREGASGKTPNALAESSLYM